MLSRVHSFFAIDVHFIVSVRYNALVNALGSKRVCAVTEDEFLLCINCFWEQFPTQFLFDGYPGAVQYARFHCIILHAVPLNPGAGYKQYGENEGEHYWYSQNCEINSRRCWFLAYHGNLQSEVANSVFSLLANERGAYASEQRRNITSNRELCRKVSDRREMIRKGS